jgi:hypothetical protein
VPIVAADDVGDALLDDDEDLFGSLADSDSFGSPRSSPVARLSCGREGSSSSLDLDIELANEGVSVKELAVALAKTELELALLRFRRKELEVSRSKLLLVQTMATGLGTVMEEEDVRLQLSGDEWFSEMIRGVDEVECGVPVS